jgi:hypothetical protein
MGWQVVMSLLESVVLFDVVQVISSKDHGSVHLGGKNDSLKDSTSDGNVGSEWALVIDVVAFNSSSWGLETYSILQLNINTLYLPRPTFL